MDWGLVKVLDREDGKDIPPQADPGPLTSVIRSDRHDQAAAIPGMLLVTIDGDVVETPARMPPEHAAGDLSAMGPHSDVYAGGAMLYHLLAGHMPYVRPGYRAVIAPSGAGPRKVHRRPWPREHAILLLSL